MITRRQSIAMAGLLSLAATMTRSAWAANAAGISLWLVDGNLTAGAWTPTAHVRIVPRGRHVTPDLVRALGPARVTALLSPGNHLLTREALRDTGGEVLEDRRVTAADLAAAGLSQPLPMPAHILIFHALPGGMGA